MRQTSGVVIQCMAPAAAAGDVEIISTFITSEEGCS